MNVLVLLILAAVWAVFLIPQVLRARTEAKPSDSIGAFQRQLSVLERSSPPGPGVPARIAPGAARATAADEAQNAALLPELSRSEARKRRKDVFTGLLAVAAGSFVLAVVVGGTSLVVAHLLVDVLLVSYVVLLVRARTIAAERAVKVRYLPGRSTEPLLALRRSAT